MASGMRMFRRFIRCARLVALTAALVFGGTPLVPTAVATAAEIPVPPGSGLQAAIASAEPGDTLLLSAGEYTTSGQVMIDKDVTIVGAGIDQTVLKTTTNTPGASITTSLTTGWFTVLPSGELTVSGLTMDGEHSTGVRTGAAVYASGPLHASDVRVTDVWWGSYVGTGFVLIGAGHDVTGCLFDAVERLGLYIGAGSSVTAPDMDPAIPYGAIIENCTFIGYGPGDHCQYSMEVGRSGRALVRNIYVTGYSGVTAVNAWNSAGLLVDSYYGSGTASMTLESSVFEDCEWGVEVGFPTQPRDTVLHMSNNTFERVPIDLNVNGPTSVVSIPDGADNEILDRDWVYEWTDETDSKVIPPPELPDGFINWTPRVDSDEYDVAKNVQLVIGVPGVLGNDVDSDDDTLTVSLVDDVTEGSLTLDDDGSFTYSPSPGFVGTDTFTYRVSDWLVTSAVTTVTLTVSNSAPAVTDDEWRVRQGGLLLSGGRGVLANDVDVNGDGFSARLETDVANGTLLFHSDGTFVYQPDAAFTGVDSFTYVASDGVSESEPGTVRIDVWNEAPEATPDSYSLLEDGTLFVSVPGVLGNDADAEGGTMSAIVDTPTDHGALVLASNGSFIYVPNPGFHGTDSFTYRASDGLGMSSPVAVSIVVTAVPSASVVASLTPSKTLAKYGDPYVLRGTLLSVGVPVVGGRVVLQQSAYSAGPFTDMSLVATTAADGSFTLTDTPRSKRYYRARFDGIQDEYLPVTSAVRYARPRTWVRTPIARKTMTAGLTYTVRGYLRPRHRSRTYPVRIYRQRYVAGKWVTHGYVRARVSYHDSATSKYTARVMLPYRGRWRLRAYAPSDSRHARAWSVKRAYVTVK